MTKPTTEDLQGLADKVDGLHLAEPERAILDAVLERAKAEGAEVEGFIYDGLKGDAKKSLTPTAQSFFDVFYDVSFDSAIHAMNPDRK